MISSRLESNELRCGGIEKQHLGSVILHPSMDHDIDIYIHYFLCVLNFSNLLVGR